jgi:toxin FitB
MFLLDTNTISELRKIALGRADANVAAWEAEHPPSELYVSVITLMEIEVGILRLAIKDKARSETLKEWRDAHVLPFFEGRVFQVTQDIAERCAALHVPKSRPAHDALIAATALVHGLTLVTRNVSDFAPMGVKILNPWEPQG